MIADRSTTYMNKTTWGPGPWQDEPDHIQWVDEASGLDCLVVRNHLGALCGYVGTPPGHAYHGADYDELSIDVHGGLTFGGMCDERAEEGHGICHVPLPGRPADVFWLGFDCGHAFDYAPGSSRYPSTFGLGVSEDRFDYGTNSRGETYRDVEYVQAQCVQLARQLAEVAAD